MFISSADCSFKNLESVTRKTRKDETNTSLSNGDLHLIEILKRQRPLITHSEIIDGHAISLQMWRSYQWLDIDFCRSRGVG